MEEESREANGDPLPVVQLSGKAAKDIYGFTKRPLFQSRGGDLPEGLIHHSDRGSTYASYSYEALLKSFGICQSMSAKGNCYDNAAKESFYGRYKTSSVGDTIFFDDAAARSDAFDYIEVFYNRFRKHSSLDYNNPIQFEEKFYPHGGKQNASLPACIKHN
ncbi:MAG: integrase core domain-containing protein [Opitutaceae bacterium]